MSFFSNLLKIFGVSEKPDAAEAVQVSPPAPVVSPAPAVPSGIPPVDFDDQDAYSEELETQLQLEAEELERMRLYDDLAIAQEEEAARLADEQYHHSYYDDDY